MSNVAYRRAWQGTAALLVALSLGTGAGWYFRLAPVDFGVQIARVAATPMLAWWYRADLDAAAHQRRDYWRGTPNPAPSGTDSVADGVANGGADSWRRLTRESSHIANVRYDGLFAQPMDSPFVYESTDAPQLSLLKARYNLKGIVDGAADEYDAMLKLGAWVGTRWDHGTDVVPGGNRVPRVADVIAAGEGGLKFWCEIAARTMVQAATAMGWPARLVSLSRDGYAWEHAVAEVWSNQFAKWIVIDTDFNLVYEVDGRPLSAFELCHDGLRLQAEKRLKVRSIAPPKPSLPPQDLLPFYRYVHIDLRNDWSSRNLAPGSPAAGDRATWWTARPELGPELTAKVRVDDAEVFNWPVNVVHIDALGITPEGAAFNLQLRAWLYSPYERDMELSVDDGAWKPLNPGPSALLLAAGAHTLRARVAIGDRTSGPERRVTFTLRGDSR